MGARAFLRLDPATAYDRAEAFFTSQEAKPARAARALLEELSADAGPNVPSSHGLLAADPRWLDRARRVDGPRFVLDAATTLLRLAERS